MSRGARARAQKPDLPISRRQAARAGNTRFAHNRDVARRARGARKNRICPSQGGRRRARAIPGSPITGMSRARARAQKPDLPISRRQAARAGNTRFAHNRDVARRARGARKNRICPSQGGRRRARAIPGSPITGMSRGARAARAKTRSAHLKAAGGARGQYPVRP